MDKKSQLVKQLIENGVTQQELATFLGVTRQTIKRCSDGYALTSKMEKFEYISGKDIDIIKKILRIDQLSNEILKKLTDNPSTIDKALQGFEYLHHWITDSKYNIEFTDYIFGHIVNFHMRYNPYTLMLRDYFHRENHPVLAFNIDYHNDRIKNYYVIPIQKQGDYQTFPINYKNNMNLKFTEFIDSLYEICGETIRLNVYLDREDDEFGYLKSKLNSEYRAKIDKMSIYDFSRMFNFFESGTKEGPQIEAVLDLFNIQFDKNILLKDSKHRAIKIVELVTMVSLAQIRDDFKIGSDVIFDGSSKRSDKKYLRDRRREKK